MAAVRGRAAAVALALAVAAALAGASAAEADEGAAASSSTADPLTGRGYLAVGSFANSTALDIRLDGASSGAIGTEVDWDQRFGLKDAKRFRVDGVWRFAPRHHLRLLYTDYSQDDRGTVQGAIQWGDDVIPVGAEVTAGLGFEVIELEYEYALVSTPRSEVAASLGLHYTTLEARLSAVVTAGGVGVGYDAFGVDIDLRKDGFRGKVDWTYRGSQAFVTLTF